MDLIGLVKDSFAAVVQEVEAARLGKPSPDSERSQKPATVAATGELEVVATPAPTIEPEITGVEMSGVESRRAEFLEASPGVSFQADGPQETSVSSAVSSTTTTEDAAQQLAVISQVLQQASDQLTNGQPLESKESNAAKDANDAEQLQIAMLDEIGQGQVELRKRFDSRIHSDEVQSRALERLHQELQEGRKLIQRSELQPVLKDIIFCHDFVARELETPASNRDEVPQDARWRKSFELLGQMLLDVLFKYDVEPFRSESEGFDRSLQQCVKTEVTDDETLDKQIAAAGLAGFRNADRIIRREQVSVYKYRPAD